MQKNELIYMIKSRNSMNKKSSISYTSFKLYCFKQEKLIEKLKKDYSNFSYKFHEDDSCIEIFIKEENESITDFMNFVYSFRLKACEYRNEIIANCLKSEIRHMAYNENIYTISLMENQKTTKKNHLYLSVTSDDKNEKCKITITIQEKIKSHVHELIQNMIVELKLSSISLKCEEKIDMQKLSISTTEINERLIVFVGAIFGIVAKEIVI